MKVKPTRFLGGPNILCERKRSQEKEPCGSRYTGLRKAQTMRPLAGEIFKEVLAAELVGIFGAYSFVLKDEFEPRFQASE